MHNPGAREGNQVMSEAGRDMGVTAGTGRAPCGIGYYVMLQDLTRDGMAEIKGEKKIHAVALIPPSRREYTPREHFIPHRALTLINELQPGLNRGRKYSRCGA